MNKENKKEPISINILHLIYPLIISLLIMTFIVTIFFVGEESLDDKITFAATFISIIIGALAIFIAVYQGMTQSTSVEKIQEASNRVEKVTKSLEELQGITEKIENVETSFQTGINEVKEQMIKGFKVSESSGSSEKITFIKEEFSRLFGASDVTKRVNYFIYRLYAEEKLFHTYELIGHITEIKKGSTTFSNTIDMTLLQAHLAMYISINEFKITSKDGNNKVHNVPDYFEEYCLELRENFYDILDLDTIDVLIESDIKLYK